MPGSSHPSATSGDVVAEVTVATPADVSLLLRLIGDLARYERLEDQMQGDEALLHDALFGARAVAEAAVAWVDGEGGRVAAGFALYFRSFSTFLCRPGIWLEDLFVEPEHRGGGVGRALLRHVARRAVAEGGRLEWAVLDWNDPAIGFYRRIGAVPLDDWTVNRLHGDPLLRLAEGGADPG